MNKTDRFWLTRMYICLSTLSSFLIAAISPMSLNARAIEAAGEAGWVVVAALSFVSLVALIESFVSHFVDGFEFWWLRSRRQLMFMSIAIGQVCVGYAIVVYSPDSAGLVVRFLLDATVAAVVAFLDMFSRHRLDLK